MMKALLIAAACLLLLAVVPEAVQLLTWVLAFLTLLMLGDLIRSAVRRRWR